MKSVILAVDAGGTKTKVALLSEENKIVYEIIGGYGSPAVSKEGAFKNIKEIVLRAINENIGLFDIKYIQMGISGLGVIWDKKIIEKELEAEFNIETSLENDAVLALYSVVKDESKEGIVVLAGTGSAVVGCNNDKIELIGGWGHLLMERASAYATSKRVICNIIDEYEKTRSISSFHKRFLNYINIDKVDQLKAFVFGSTKGEIAHLAKFISDNSYEEEVEEILKEMGLLFARDVKLLYKHLNLGLNVVIGYKGSFICNAKYVKETLISELQKDGFMPKEIDASHDPIYGAYYLAKLKGKIC